MIPVSGFNVCRSEVEGVVAGHPGVPRCELPRCVEFRDPLPRTPIGTILREELREVAEEVLRSRS